MSQYVTLMGAEEVSRAASNMREAAAEMNRAASSFDHAADRQRMNMDDWLVRFEALIERMERALNPESPNV